MAPVQSRRDILKTLGLAGIGLSIVIELAAVVAEGFPGARRPNDLF